MRDARCEMRDARCEMRDASYCRRDFISRNKKYTARNKFHAYISYEVGLWVRPTNNTAQLKTYDL